jgi:hypothetical protein
MLEIWPHRSPEGKGTKCQTKPFGRLFGRLPGFDLGGKQPQLRLISMTRSLAVILVVIVTACAGPRQRPTLAAGPCGNGDAPDPLILQARRDAADAIRIGHLYVCDAGTIGLYSPGVAPSQQFLIRGLPRRLLPSGCTNPEAHRSIAYSEAFNREILRYLESSSGRKCGAGK